MLRKIAIKLAKIFIIFIIVAIGVVAILPNQAKAEDTYATLNLTANDPQGLKITNVNFNVFEQKTDINNNFVLGDKLAGGNIGATGLLSIKIKLAANITKVIALEYYKDSSPYGRFTLWNQTITGNQSKDVTLTFSTFRIVLKDAGGQLLKDLPFNIYSTVIDVLGNKVAKDNIYGGQKTGLTGEKIFYLIPGNYILRINYPGINNLDALDYLFTVNQNSQTDLIYTLSDINVSVRDVNHNLKDNADFKLYKEGDRSNNYEYDELGTFNTGSTGTKEIFLPAGDYKIEFKGSDGKFSNTMGFSLVYGQEQNFFYDLGTFRLRVLYPDNEPVVNQRVNIYKYANNQRQSLIYWGTTNSNGQIELPLTAGYYIAEIDGIYHGLNYQTGVFYVADNSNGNLDYTLSKARIYLQNSANQTLQNQLFTLYHYSYDSTGNTKAGSEISTFSTGYIGYAEIYLPPDRYIVKLSDQNTLYPISVNTGTLNNLYVPLRGNYSSQNTNINLSLSTQSSTDTSLASFYQNDLYYKDTDGDGLSDFEEIYIYHTNPFSSDTDNDGFADKTEIKNGYNPNGPGSYYYEKFNYGKPRVTSLSVERELAAFLKTELEKKIGRDLGVKAKDWKTLVNAYIYGGYTIDELKDTLVYGPGMVHPTIPASAWRQAEQYGQHR